MCSRNTLACFTSRRKRNCRIALAEDNRMTGKTSMNTEGVLNDSSVFIKLSFFSSLDTANPLERVLFNLASSTFLSSIVHISLIRLVSSSGWISFSSDFTSVWKRPCLFFSAIRFSKLAVRPGSVGKRSFWNCFGRVGSVE